MQYHQAAASPRISNTFPRIIAHLHKPKQLSLLASWCFCVSMHFEFIRPQLDFYFTPSAHIDLCSTFLQPNNFDKWRQLTGSLDLMAIVTTIFAGHQIRCDFIIFLSANHVLSQQSSHKYGGLGERGTPVVYKDSNLRNYGDPTHNKRKKFNDHVSQHREVAVQRRLFRYSQTEFNPRSMVPEIC